MRRIHGTRNKVSRTTMLNLLSLVVKDVDSELAAMIIS